MLDSRCIAELLETLLAEENVMDVVGALEYDPELAARQNHRQFLREHVIFKEVSQSHSIGCCDIACVVFSGYHDNLMQSYQ